MVCVVELRESCGGRLTASHRGNPVAVDRSHWHIAGFLLHSRAAVGPAVLLQPRRALGSCRSAWAPTNEIGYD